MNPPYVIHAATVTPLPLVLDSPHSGNRFPEDFGAAASERQLRDAEDWYVDELWGAAPTHGAPLLAANFPRTYIDPNRHAGDGDLELLEGAWPLELRASGKARIGKGLIWRTLEDGAPIYARKLSAEEIRRRIERYHAPYHAALRGLLDDAHRRHGVVFHLNCHSMRAVAGKQSDDGEGTRRADFVLGDRDGTSCAPGFTDMVRTALSGLGYSVKLNDPYKGVELVRAYSDPAAGRHSLQVEINRGIYLDEVRYEKTARFGALRADLERLLGHCARHAREAATQIAAQPRGLV